MSKDIPDTRRKAVALSDGMDGAPPTIAASGSGLRAEEILDIAFAEGVPVRQDQALTDILAHFEELSPIPIEAIHAVAEVMSHVYAESKRHKDKS